MKTIEKFEAAKESGKKLNELGINPTLYWAYRNSLKAGNESIDFDEVIWDREIEEIVAQLQAEGITEFTISSNFSSLIKTLAEFEKYGCRMAGLTEVRTRFEDFNTNEKQIVPAIKMIIE